MKLLERDTMVYEVAREMLTAPAARLSNRMRKNCQSAMVVCYVADAPRKPLETKVTARLATRPIARVARECRRAWKQRRGVQRRYESLRAAESNPVIELRIAALNLLANHLDAVIECCEKEIATRKSICAHLPPQLL